MTSLEPLSLMDAFLQFTASIPNKEAHKQKKTININRLRSLSNIYRNIYRDNIDQYKYVSPSQYHETCYKKIWYAWTLSNEVFQQLMPEYKLRLSALLPFKILDFGTQLHKLNAKEYFSNLDVGVWLPFGDWKCSTCNTKKTACYKPNQCTNTVTVTNETNGVCDTKSCKEHGHWVYDEYRIISEKYGTAGTVDLLLIHKDTKEKVIVDYKYVSSHIYKNFEKTRFFQKYVSQLSIYVLLLGANCGIIDLINRDNPDLEKEIYVDSVDNEIVSNLLKIGDFIKNIKTQTLTDKLKSCSESTEDQAMRCPFKQLCFNEISEKEMFNNDYLL